MSLKLELGKMKHVKSDDKTTTLRHPAGHTVTIIHSSLSPENQTALKALSKLPAASQTPLQSDESKHQSGTKMAKGGDVKAKQRFQNSPSGQNMYAEGDSVSPAPSGQQDPAPKSTNETDANKTANVNTPSSWSDALNRLAHPLAEGGEIKKQPKPENAIDYSKFKRKPPQQPSNTLDYQQLRKEYTEKNRPKYANGTGEVAPPDPDKAAAVKAYEQGSAEQRPQQTQRMPHARPTEESSFGGDENAPKKQDPLDAVANKVAEPHAHGGAVCYACGGKVRMYADGTPPGETVDNTPWTEKFGQKLGSAAKDVAGVMTEPVKQVGTAAMNLGEGAVNMGKGFVKGADLAPPPEPEEQPTPQSAQPEPQQPYQVGPPTPQQDPSQTPPQQQMTDAYGTQAYADALKQGVNEQQAGIQQQSLGQMQAAESKAKADVAYTNALANQQNIMNNRFNANLKNVNDTIQDIDNNHINPNHYMESRDSGQKVRQAIGLMLGGFGQAYTHGSNPAMDFINKQIDRDIASQQAAQGDRKTILGAYQQQYQDNNVANLMAKATIQQKYANDIDKAAADAATPIAAGQMLQASGQLKQASADAIRQATMMHSVLGGAKAPGAVTGRPYGPQDEAEYDKLQNYYQYTNPEMAKKRAEAHVAGVGDAPPGTVIPNEVRQQIIAHKSMNDLMNMSLDFSKKPMPNPVTSPKEYAQYTAQSKALQGQLIGQVKQAQHDGVYKPSEAEFLIGQIGGAPGSIFANMSSVPKLQELQKVKQTEYNHLLETYNLPNQNLPQGGQPQAPQQNQPVIGKDGRSYIRVGNVMRPVK